MKSRALLRAGALLLVLTLLLPALAVDSRQGLEKIDESSTPVGDLFGEILAAGGGDAGSPWPTWIQPLPFPSRQRPRRGASAVRAGGAVLFAWSGWDGSDGEILLARFGDAEATQQRLTDDLADDTAPQLVASRRGGLAVIWTRRLGRRGRELWALPLDAGGNPSGRARPIARYSPRDLRLTALPLSGGEWLIARLRRDVSGQGADVLLDLGPGAFYPVARIPEASGPFALEFRPGENGSLTLDWTAERQEDTGQRERGGSGWWNSPRVRPPHRSPGAAESPRTRP